MDEAQSKIAQSLREQSEWARKLGSPLYNMLLTRSAEDVESGGPCWQVLAGHEHNPSRLALPLQFAGAVHRLVLEGRAPDLARYYASVGGVLPFEQAWPAFRDSVETHQSELRSLVNHPVQTNEVGRSCALLGGFLLVARETKLPLRLLELGASAGLNLRWDRYWYQAGSEVWGDPASPIRFENAFSEGRPPLDTTVRIEERSGCDINPLDPAAPETELTLRSYIWPDQPSRHERLHAVLAIARQVPARLDQAGAADWLARELPLNRPGAATVVFHSVVMPYLPKEERERVRELLLQAGGRASAAAPLAWLQMEHGGDQADVRLTLWPGGEQRLIATAAYHGPPVRWLIP